MKTTFTKFHLSLILSLFVFNLVGQITKTKYLVQYDATCDLFKCKLVIDEGNTTDIASTKVVIGSQFSLVTKTGLKLVVINSHNPKVSSTNIPCSWFFNSFKPAPAAQPKSDFYSVTNSISPTTKLGNVSIGDTISLFDVKVIEGEYSPSDIRPFEKGVDPKSDDPGMNGTDYRNEFTLLYPGKTYSGNIASNYLTQTEVNEYCTQECVTLSPIKLGLKQPVEIIWGDGLSLDSREFCPKQDTTINVTIIDGNNISYNKTYVLHFSDFDIEENMDMCLQDTVNLPPLTSSGTWLTQDRAIAELKQFTDLIVAKSIGTCQFVYNDCSNPCVDNKTVTVNVLGENHPNCVVSSTNDDLLNSFKYYPNPASGYIHLESQNDCTVNLIDNFGRALYKNVALNGKARLDMDQMSPGVYYIIVKTNTEQKRYPLVKL